MAHRPLYWSRSWAKKSHRSTSPCLSITLSRLTPTLEMGMEMGLDLVSVTRFQHVRIRARMACVFIEDCPNGDDDSSPWREYILCTDAIDPPLLFLFSPFWLGDVQPLTVMCFVLTLSARMNTCRLPAMQVAVPPHLLFSLLFHSFFYIIIPWFSLPTLYRLALKAALKSKDSVVIILGIFVEFNNTVYFRLII